MAQKVEERRILTPWWVYESIDDKTTDVLAITGGLGSGKTTGSAMWFIDRWLLNRNSQFSWAVAPTHTKIEQILLPAVRQVLHDVYGMVEDVHYRIYKGRFFKLVCKGYQHEIHFLSGDRPGLFVGSNVACLWITEPGLMVREVYEKGQTRLRCPRAVVRQTLLEGTPEGMSGKGGWYAEVCNVPGAGYDRRGTVGPQNGVRRFIVETTHNKHLKPSPEEYAQKKIRDVFSYDPAKILSYEKGLFVPFTKSTGYWEFVESRNVVGQHEVHPQTNLPIIMTWDFNKTPLAWVMLQRQPVTTITGDRYHRFVALKECSGNVRGIAGACDEFAAKLPAAHFGNVPIEVYGDRSGFSGSHLVTEGDSYDQIRDCLRDRGYRNVRILAENTTQGIQASLERTAALMAYGFFVVSSECVMLIKSFQKTSLKEGTWDIAKGGPDDVTHWGDAVRYALFQITRHENILDPNARPTYGFNL